MDVAMRSRLNPEAHEMLGAVGIFERTSAEEHNASVPNLLTASLLETPRGRMILPRQRQKRLSRGACLSLALVLALAFASGCNRNKNGQVPRQATVPTIAVPPTAQAGQQPAPPVQTTPPPATSAETGAVPQSSTNQTNTKPKPQRNSARKTSPAAKPAPAAQPAQAAPPAPPPPQKPAAPGSGEGQVQIAAEVPQGTAQNTEQLLQTAEGNLRKVTRQLSDGQQAMLRQARNYIAQSRSATQDGDLERAYNLAIKANLLSSELAK